MLQPRQHDLLARLLNLARQKYLVQNSVHLVKIKHQVQLTHVAKECVQHLDEEMYGFKVGELVVVCVDAGAEEEARVATVDYLWALPEFDEVGLMFLVARGYEAVDLL
jgi:hypothetical protein